MNAAKYIRYILTIATALLFFSACKDDKNESQPTDFILRVNESVSIKLPNSTSYTITTNNSAISYELSGKILTVTAIKEGKVTLTVILDSGESHNYSFTISANSYQMGFTIDSTPRIESWISGSTVKTEETAGLQVSCEPGMDITGSPTDKSVRSYGFTYVETGKLLRFSAQGDFSQKGILNNGIMATRDNDNTTHTIRGLHGFHRKSKRCREDLVHFTIYRPKRHSYCYRNFLKIFIAKHAH